jgi:signal transduction histidine kinase
MKRLLVILFIFNTALLNQNVVGQLDSLCQRLKVTRPDTAMVAILLKITEIQSLKNVDSMQHYALKAIELSRKINDLHGLGKGYYFAGRAYNTQGIYDIALENLLKAKKICTETKDEFLLADVILNIGNVYWYSEKFAEAKTMYTEAQEHARKSGNKHAEAAVFVNIGLINMKLNQYDSSMHYLKKAYEFNLELNDRPVQALALFNLGELYSKMAKYDSAVYFFRHTLDKYEDLTPSIKARIFVSLASVYLRKGDIRQAEQYVKIALPKAVGCKSLLTLAEYYKVSFKIDSVKGNYKDAIRSLNEAGRLKEKMLNDKYETKLSAYQTFYQFEKKEKEIQLLRIDNEKISLRVSQSKLYFILSVIVTVVLLGLIFIIFRLFKIKMKKNRELRSRNFELKEQKSELQVLNDEISAQREALYQKNKELQFILEQLKETKMQLIHSEKMASVGLLAAGVAHEINTPLYYITGSLKILENTLQEFTQSFRNDIAGTNEELYKVMQEMISNANIGAENVMKIVKSLMTFAFRGESKSIPEDIHILIDNTLTLIRHNIPECITIEKKYGNELPKVFCLPDLMHQVFLNIITNAVQAIQTKEYMANEKIIIETGLIKNRNYVTIKIINTGPRIPDGQMKSIFDPFFTTKEHGKGVGLGLAICYNIVREHEGFIEARNLTAGVEFIISLPC